MCCGFVASTVWVAWVVKKDFWSNKRGSEQQPSPPNTHVWSIFNVIICRYNQMPCEEPVDLTSIWCLASHYLTVNIPNMILTPLQVALTAMSSVQKQHAQVCLVSSTGSGSWWDLWLCWSGLVGVWWGAWCGWGLTLTLNSQLCPSPVQCCSVVNMALNTGRIRQYSAYLLSSY